MSITFTDTQLEHGRVLFSGPCDFMLGVAQLNQLPETDMPEVAFAGRSNVGKSSLVNALTGRKTLAKTSNTPGRTQQLNYFDLGGKLYMVDMPGYGYAKVSKAQKKAWNQLIWMYLQGRPNLRCVLILIDARHGLKDSDIELMTMLDQTAVSYRLILTKADKVKNQELETRIQDTEDVLKTHVAGFPQVTVTSAQKDTGVQELRAIVATFADYNEE